MTMPRLNRILAGLLVLQLALIAWIFQGPADPSERTAGPLLSDWNAESLTGIRIASGPDTLVELSQRDGAWVVPARQGYPADAAKVAALLDKLEKLDTKNLVARSPASHRRLKVAGDDFNRRIELLTDGHVVHRLYLGSSPGYRKIHIRRDGDDAVYVAGGLAAWELNTDAASWLRYDYVRVEEAGVSRIRFENAAGRFSVEKGDNGTWELVDPPAGRRLDTTRWTPLLHKALALRMAEPLGTDEKPDYGLDKPILTLTLEGRDDAGLPVRIRVGAGDEEKKSYAVKASNSAFYVRVADYAVKDLVGASRNDLTEAVSAAAGDGAPAKTGGG